MQVVIRLAAVMQTLHAKVLVILSVVLLFAGCGPSTAPEHLQAAEEYRIQGELPNAIYHAKNAVHLKPADPQANQALGDLYLLAKKPRAALRAFEAARLHGAESPELLLANIRAKLGAGLYEQVITEIQQLDALPPEAERILADAYYKSKDYENAKTLYRKFADPGQFATLGRLERKLGRYESALEAYKKSYIIYADGKTLLELARMQRFFDHEASIKQFNQLAVIPGFASDADAELVRTYWLMGDDQTASTHLNSLVHDQPNRRKTKFLQGIYDLKRGDWESAFSDMLILYITSPNEDLLLPLALVEYEMKSFTAARIYAQRLLFRDPLSDSAAKIIFLTSDSYNHPVTPAIKRLLYVTHDPQLLRMIGEHSLRTGRTDIALEAFSRARRALNQPVGTDVSFYVDLGMSPGRARLHLPIQTTPANEVYGDNCFGLAASLDTKQDTPTAGPCPAAVLKFLLGLRSMNSSDTDSAVAMFEAALQLDPSLKQAKLLLAQTRDSRLAGTGFRHASVADTHSNSFSTKSYFPETSPAQLEELRATYSDLFGMGIYEVSVIQAELMLAKGRTRSATALLNRLTKTNPARIEAHRVLATFNIHNSNGERWLEQARRKMIKPLWDSWDMRMMRAQIYQLSDKRKSQTARYLQDQVDLHPSFPTERLFELAELQLRLGQESLAYENYNQLTNDRYATTTIKTAARERLSELQLPDARRVADISSQ